MGEPNDQVSDCSYCGMRFKVLGLPHKYGCPGLEIERLTTEVSLFKGKCDDMEIYVCELEEKLRLASAEGTTMRISLQAIAKHYKPNWKPGDTHVSTQRLSGIAHDALAVCASGSQPPLEDLPIDDEDRKWADSRVDGRESS